LLTLLLIQGFQLISVKGRSHNEKWSDDEENDSNRAAAESGAQNPGGFELHVAEVWERNARMYKGAMGEHLGDEWSEGEGLALGVSAEQVLAYLDEKILRPFIGELEITREFTERAGLFLERCDTENFKDGSFALFSKPA